jgi:hypothetical protein
VALRSLTNFHFLPLLSAAALQALTNFHYLPLLSAAALQALTSFHLLPLLSAMALRAVLTSTMLFLNIAVQFAVCLFPKRTASAVIFPPILASATDVPIVPNRLRYNATFENTSERTQPAVRRSVASAEGRLRQVQRSALMPAPARW